MVTTYSAFSVTSDETTLLSDGCLAATVTAIIHNGTGAIAPAGTTVTWAFTPAASSSTTTFIDVSTSHCR